jgi:hypothetical protein
MFPAHIYRLQKADSARQMAGATSGVQSIPSTTRVTHRRMKTRGFVQIWQIGIRFKWSVHRNRHFLIRVLPTLPR